MYKHDDECCEASWHLAAEVNVYVWFHSMCNLDQDEKCTNGLSKNFTSAFPCLAGLAQAIQFVDQALGNLAASLQANGLADSTVTIVTAKHGQSPILPQLVRQQLAMPQLSNSNTVSTWRTAPSTYLSGLRLHYCQHAWPVAQRAATHIFASIVAMELPFSMPAVALSETDTLGDSQVEKHGELRIQERIASGLCDRVVSYVPEMEKNDKKKPLGNLLWSRRKE